MSGWQWPLVGLALVVALVLLVACTRPQYRRKPFVSDRDLNAHRITQTLPNNWLKDFKDRNP